MRTRVLVVDDSAVVRQALALVLGRAGMIVATANDPMIAMGRLERERPDAIVLDLEMPRMDGLTFLRKLMAEDPLPVVVCSGLAGPRTELALQALEAGAVDVISKPRLGVKEFLEGSAAQIVQVVRAAAQARVSRRPGVDPPAVAVPPRPAHGASARGSPRSIVVMGASTGGTEALRALLEAMPRDAPGIAIVQHMPEIFTAQFARRLDRSCRIEVKEAARDDRVIPGRALIARGNHHLVVRRAGEQYLVDVLDGPAESLHRPSVDVLFRSAAEAAGPDAVGVLLTGMGEDGAAGMSLLKAAGAHTIAQDEETSVVFGMPREAIARGAVDEVLPLARIARAILWRTT